MKVNLVKRLLRPLLNNRASTDDSWWYPDLAPRVYATSPDEAFDAVRNVIDGHPRWKISDANRDDMVVKATAKTPTIGFVDDVIIQLEKSDDECVEVHVTSESRVGTGDLEANARRIRTFFELLDRRLL